MSRAKRNLVSSRWDREGERERERERGLERKLGLE
jgi:hypothetical protein